MRTSGRGPGRWLPLISDRGRRRRDPLAGVTGEALAPGSDAQEIGTKPADTTKRNPLLSFLFAGSFLFRFAERQFLALLFQEPPRSTRNEPLGLPMPDRHAAGAGILA